MIKGLRSWICLKVKQHHFHVIERGSSRHLISAGFSVIVITVIFSDSCYLARFFIFLLGMYLCFLSRLEIQSFDRVLLAIIDGKSGRNSHLCSASQIRNIDLKRKWLKVVLLAETATTYYVIHHTSLGF